MMANNSEPAFMRPVFVERQQSGYPQIRQLHATVYVIITALILTYSGLFGVIPILLLYAIWFPHIYYKKIFTLRLTKDIYGPVMFGVLCVASSLWSDYREITLKASLEFASMIACTIIIARIVSMESLVKGLILGLFLILLVPFKSGSYSIDGLFGSKNQVGGIAELGFYIAIIYLCTKKQRAKKLLFCALPLLLFSACLVYSKSATSVASLAAALGISYVAYSLARFPPRYRMPLLIATLFFMVIFVVAGFYWGLQDVGLTALGKDSTLTGRTYLWSQGIKFGMQQPFLGVGYEAFWVVGRPLAEQLWYEFYIFERAGFHFHNLFVNVFVELGLCGFLIVAYIYITTCVASFRFLVKNGASLESVFFVGLSIMYCIRAFAEVDTTGPFGMGPLLLFSILPRITELNKNKPTPQVTPVTANKLPFQHAQPAIVERP